MPILIQVALYSPISFPVLLPLSLFWIKHAGAAVFRDIGVVKVEVDY